MERSREDSARWALRKAGEYLESARHNLKAGRLFPTAEEIFRSVETSLEALLYHYGVRRIEYPGGSKKFTGRLALQFLVRDTLLSGRRIDRNAYDRYMALAAELHLAAYRPRKVFARKELQEDLRFAEDLLIKARSIIRV
jgi:hypothetical protein